MASALRRDSSHDGNVCDLAAIEALRVVRATAAGTNAVLHGLKFDKVASLAASQSLEAVIRRVLEDVAARAKTAVEREYSAISLAQVAQELQS